MDELIKAIMMEAAKQAAQQKGSKPCSGSMNYDEVSAIKKDVIVLAKYTKMQFDQFVAVGFTEEQAMALTVAVLNK